MVESEAYAMRGEEGRRLRRRYAATPALSPLPQHFAQALRCGKMIYVSGQSPVDGKGELQRPGDIVGQTNQVMAQIGAALAEVRAGFDDVVKVNRGYAGHGTVAEFDPAAAGCARQVQAPSPAATA